MREKPIFLKSLKKEDRKKMKKQLDELIELRKKQIEKINRIRKHYIKKLELVEDIKKNRLPVNYPYLKEGASRGEV